MHNEVDAIKDRYARRKSFPESQLYHMLNPSVYMAKQERERAVISWITSAGIFPPDNKKLLEVGCGEGGNLLDFLRLGFPPENLVGNELLEDRGTEAKRRLPCTTRLIIGDASELDLPDGSFDVVMQSTVFTSILDQNFQHKLADRMWGLVKPGGGVLWYDFVYNNPKNPDVRGVPIRRIRELFPSGDIRFWRLTLAPPISRLVTRLHPALYTVFNAVPLLRTHVLCWIRKAC